MSEFVIIPDSSCDMVESLRKRFDIPAIVPGIIYKPDGTQMSADIDWENMSPEEYYTSMSGRKVLYKTATPPIGQTMEVFEKFLKEGKDILTITLSSGISSTYRVFENIRSELEVKYPERKIICVDSLRYASAIALLVVEAAKKRTEGATIEQTAEYLNDLRHRIHQMGPLDDLFFCVKTGRVSNFKALFGTLVGVNTLGEFNRQGMPIVAGKVKGKKMALAASVEYVKRMIRNPEEQTIFISHSNRREHAEMYSEMLKKEINPKEIIINPLGMSCGASIGPGLCTAFFIGDPISEDESLEKQTVSQIIHDIKTADSKEK